MVVVIHTWLVNVHFIDDHHKPTSENEWIAGIKLAKDNLMLPGTVNQVVIDVLPLAKEREVLLGS